MSGLECPRAGRKAASCTLLPNIVGPGGLRAAAAGGSVCSKGQCYSTATEFGAVQSWRGCCGMLPRACLDAERGHLGQQGQQWRTFRSYFSKMECVLVPGSRGGRGSTAYLALATLWRQKPGGKIWAMALRTTLPAPSAPTRRSYCRTCKRLLVSLLRISQQASMAHRHA